MNTEKCCPKFNPEPWDGKEIKWENKKFLKDRVKSFLTIPLNFGSRMIKNIKKMEACQAVPCEDEFLVLSNNCSVWGMDIYLKAQNDVKDAEMVDISGTFLTKVFEGPYKNIGKWIKEMKKYVDSKDKETKDLYFYYTTCPKCAKKYGKNYVVLLAKTG